MEKGIKQAVQLDDNEKIFFNRELESVKNKSYDIKYPEIKAKKFIPVSTDAGKGATTITYEQYDAVGMMKIIASFADDLPRSDVSGKEFSTPVRSIGGSYGYNVQEIRTSAMAGKNLKTRKAGATRKAYEVAVNKIAFFAKASDPQWGGLQGLLYQPNVPTSAVAKSWSTATAQEMYDDMSKAYTDVVSRTKGLEVPNMLILPLTKHSIVASKIMSSDSSQTVLAFFKANHPNVTVDWANELEDIVSPDTGSGQVSAMVCYKRHPDVLTLELPSGYEQFNAQERGLEFIVPAHGRIGGVIVYSPLAINIVEGL